MKITGTMVAQVGIVLALIVMLIMHIRGEGNWYFTIALAAFLPIVFAKDTKSNNSES